MLHRPSMTGSGYRLRRYDNRSIPRFGALHRAVGADFVAIMGLHGRRTACEVSKASRSPPHETRASPGLLGREPRRAAHLTCWGGTGTRNKMRVGTGRGEQRPPKSLLVGM